MHNLYLSEICSSSKGLYVTFKENSGFFTKSMENRPDEMASCGNYPTISYIEKARQWGSFLLRNDMMVALFRFHLRDCATCQKTEFFFFSVLHGLCHKKSKLSL